MDVLEDLEEKTLKKNHDCKGIYFRAEVSNFISGNNTDINTKLRLRFLKRKSCSGCEKCGWFWDYIGDEIFMAFPEAYLPNLEHGKVYTPVPVLESADWEMPHIKEIAYIEFQEVKE